MTVREPRKEEQEEIDEDQGTGEQEEAPKGPKVEAKGNRIKIGPDIIVPYRGDKSELPKEKLNTKGEVMAQGKPMHFIVRNADAYKIIRIYRAGGIKRCRLTTLKPKIRPNDKVLLQKLKDIGISGI